MQPDITQPSMVSEPLEAPSMRGIPDAGPIADANLTHEPAVPDISSIMSGVNQSGLVPTDSHLLGMEMPQIPPNEVSSLLGHDDHHDQPVDTNGIPQMENMGYDHVSILENNFLS